jgi:hypothetical protein
MFRSISQILFFCLHFRANSAFLILNSYFSLNPSSFCLPLRRRIFMRRYFDTILETEMLLRVVVEETDTELTVVTLYKTSKFAKYEGSA